jgi:undecaprenyl diphosphate synthase
VLNELKKYGVKHITLYAFSTENWRRPKEEVDAIMELLYKYLDEITADLTSPESDFMVRFLGDRSALPEKLQKKCDEVEAIGENRPCVCNIALNYGGRDEILHAVNAAIAEGNSVISEELVSNHTYTSHSPDPDLVIRTGGDFRVSNFLLWQIAYSEFYITETFWPDFGKEDIAAALDSYAARHRRFGGLDPEDK